MLVLHAGQVVSVDTLIEGLCGDDPLAAYSSEKYDRLVAVKNRYDPANRFYVDHNIVPAAP